MQGSQLRQGFKGAGRTLKYTSLTLAIIPAVGCPAAPYLTASIAFEDLTPK